MVLEASSMKSKFNVGDRVKGRDMFGGLIHGEVIMTKWTYEWDSREVVRVGFTGSMGTMCSDCYVEHLELLHGVDDA